eukprot:gene32751-biopygen25992
MDRLAHKCVSLQFFIEFYEQVVQPYRPTMTVQQVVKEIIIPATREKGCNFIDQLWPYIYFKDAVFSEVFVWIDIFIINQHNPGADLHSGQTLKATIDASGSVVVGLDKKTLPVVSV